jgi:hypothetical protein
VERGGAGRQSGAGHRTNDIDKTLNPAARGGGF